MALTVATAGDHPIQADNVVTGVPKSGYTAAVGHLVRRETAADNEWDLATTDETFSGLVLSINSSNGKLSIAEIVDGVTLVLPTTGTIALGDKVEATSTALSTGPIKRTVVQADNTNGIGSVIDLTPAGANTATVLFRSASV